MEEINPQISQIGTDLREEGGTTKDAKKQKPERVLPPRAARAQRGESEEENDF